MAANLDVQSFAFDIGLNYLDWDPIQAKTLASILTFEKRQLEMMPSAFLRFIRILSLGQIIVRPPQVIVRVGDSLQAAISAAPRRAIVKLMPGDHGPVGHLVVDKPLIIEGVARNTLHPDEHACRIGGPQWDTYAEGSITFEAGCGAAKLINIDVWEVPIFCNGGTPRIEHSTFTSCGLCIQVQYESRPTIKNCFITGNAFDTNVHNECGTYRNCGYHGISILDEASVTIVHNTFTSFKQQDRWDDLKSHPFWFPLAECSAIIIEGRGHACVHFNRFSLCDSFCKVVAPGTVDLLDNTEMEMQPLEPSTLRTWPM